MSGNTSRGNKDDGGNNERRCMVSKRFIVACAAVTAVALVGKDDNYHGNEKLAVMLFKVIIAAMVTHALIGCLFTLFSSSYSGSEFETTEDDGDGWSFPPDRWIKCNVDGSAPKDKASGCGGVFRDSTGSWLYGFAKSFNSCTSSAAELLAISTARYSLGSWFSQAHFRDRLTLKC